MVGEHVAQEQTLLCKLHMREDSHQICFDNAI